jgi:DNA-binding NtrC family response regulator
VPTTTPLKVLHIDKDKSFLEIARRILKLLSDIEVESAQTVTEANMALSQNNYDAVICAYYLGSLNGLDYYKQLRAKCIDTPFILFTINDETAIEAQQMGVSFVAKYGDPEKVFTTLVELIKASKQ